MAQSSWYCCREKWSLPSGAEAKGHDIVFDFAMRGAPKPNKEEVVSEDRRVATRNALVQQAERRAWDQALLIFTEVMVSEPARGLSLKSVTCSSSCFKPRV